VALFTLGVVSALHMDIAYMGLTATPGGMIDCPDGQVRSLLSLSL